MEHEVRIVKLEGRVDRLDNVVFHGEGGVPSLIASQIATNQKIDTLVTQLDTIIRFRWPLLIGLVVMLLVAMSNEFAGPLIRHIFGLPEAHVVMHSELQSARIPYIP